MFLDTRRRSHKRAAPAPRGTGARTRVDIDVCLLPWIVKRRAPARRGTARHTFKVVDLFAGCGGMTLGAIEAARMLGCAVEIALAVDLDPDAIGVYRSNFQLDDDTAREADMARLFPGRLGAPISPAEVQLQVALGPIDLLLAGPPCQGYSNLNNSTRRDDPRNRLYRRAVRAAEVLMPEVVLIENVPSVTLDRGGVVRQAVKLLRDRGYSVTTHVVDASTLGIPQQRRRHVLLATRDEPHDKDIYTSHGRAAVGSGDFLAHVPGARASECAFMDEPPQFSETTRRRIAYLFDNKLFDLPDSKRPLCHQTTHRYKSMYGRLRPDLPAQTITSGFACMGQGRFVHPWERRTLTPREAARLQGFPDFHLFTQVRSRNSLRRMIGNAVVPRVVAVPLTSLWSRQLRRRAPTS